MFQEMSPRPRDIDSRWAYPWPDTPAISCRQERPSIRPSVASIHKSLSFDGHQASSWSNFSFKIEQDWDNPTKLKTFCWCLSRKASETFQVICERDCFASFEEIPAKVAKRLEPHDEPPETAPA